MSERIYSLFEHYKQNLNLIRADPRVKMRPERDDIIVCPLCFENWFVVGAIEENLLTLEHVPPASLQGKPLALTCQVCNNNQGSKLDSPLVSYVRNIDAFTGQGSSYIDGYFETEQGHKIRIEFRASEAGWEVGAVPQASHPKHLEAINNQFRQGGMDKFNVILRLANPRKAKLGLLRSAYLFAFAYLGYGFLINRNIGVIRYQLQHPDEDVFPQQAVHIYEPNQIPDNMLGINILRQAPSSKSYFIVFDVQDKGSIPRRVGVLLPGPNSVDAKFFVELKNVESQETEVNLTHYAISFEDKLESPFLAHHIWRDG